MPGMTDTEIEGLSFALCEATVGGLEFAEARRVLAATLAVLWLPEQGPPHEDLRLQFCFLSVSRLAVSLRAGHWNDPEAEVLPVSLQDLPFLIDQFGSNIYGDRFFDVHDEELAFWGDRLSFDWRSPGADEAAHSFRLFQEGHERHLDLLVWFDGLRIFRPDFEEVNAEWVEDGSRRWWTAWKADDPRTAGHGIIRLADE